MAIRKSEPNAEPMSLSAMTRIQGVPRKQACPEIHEPSLTAKVKGRIELRRTVIGLLLLSVLGIAASFALRETSAATVNQTSITYHGGPVMTGATDIYFIWCGNWAALTGPNSKDTQDILTRFGGEIGGSIHSQINATYPDGGGYPQSFIFGWFDTAFTPPGLDLDQQAIQDIVRESIQAGHLPFDPAGIYIVVASSDIASTATGLCTPNANPHHGSFPYNNQTVKYAFMGNAARCPNILASQFFAADGSQLPTPNGNVAADAMVSTLIHTMDATVTDPFHTAWYDGSGLENADKCNGSFSHTLTAANGARYNFTSNGAQDKYLIQDNWVNNYGGYCSQYNDAPPRVDDQSIQVNHDTNLNPNANDYMDAIAVQADGKIVVGGFFTALAPNGGPSITRNHIARLNADDY